MSITDTTTMDTTTITDQARIGFCLIVDRVLTVAYVGLVIVAIITVTIIILNLMDKRDDGPAVYFGWGALTALFAYFVNWLQSLCPLCL